MVMADSERKTIVLYYMAAARGPVALQDLSEGPYQAEWFDPRTGEYTLIGTVCPEDGKYTAPAKPDGEDWLLRLRA